MNSKTHNIEQGTPEWFEMRAMRLTSSKGQAIGSNGKGLETLCQELASDYYSQSEKEHYSNSHTERGNELEPIARSMYELETGNKVDEVGFIEYGKYGGCSPDGLISEDGGIEIKCLEDKKHFEMIVSGIKIDSAHEWQIQYCLLVTGREWWDYILYNPNYKKPLLLSEYIQIKKNKKKY